MLPTLVVGWRASAVKGEEAGRRFHEVAGLSIVAAGKSVFAVDTLTADSRVASISIQWNPA